VAGPKGQIAGPEGQLAGPEGQIEGSEGQMAGADAHATAAADDPPVLANWAALPPLPAAYEQKMTARRDAALSAHADPAALAKLRKRIEEGVAARREWFSSSR
jgi:hypothetical protein